jgi:hypothetical protein
VVDSHSRIVIGHHVVEDKMIDVNTIIGSLAAIIAVIATFYIGAKNLRNTNAAGDADISNAWKELIAPMQNRIAQLEASDAVSKIRIDELETGRRQDAALIAALNTTTTRQAAQIRSLTDLVIGLGGNPPPFNQVNGKV